jgi:hypothetical protein
MGFQVEIGLTAKPLPGDVLVSWNRIAQADSCARQFEELGNPVLVAENASWGNEFAGEHWYTLARTHHNMATGFPVGGHERWDGLGVELAPLRGSGETVILPQRGIGSHPVAMPHGWADKAFQRHGGRVRRHPGRSPCVPLHADLERAGRVVTWGSGAAILAALWGCEVVSEMPGWIGEHAPPDRLAMFRRLAWAQWRLSEIESGEAFARLLGH